MQFGRSLVNWWWPVYGLYPPEPARKPHEARADPQLHWQGKKLFRYPHLYRIIHVSNIGTPPNLQLIDAV